MRWIVMARNQKTEGWDFSHVAEWSSEVLKPTLDGLHVGMAVPRATLPSYGALLFDFPLLTPAQLAGLRHQGQFFVFRDRPLTTPRTRRGQACPISAVASLYTGVGVRLVLLDETAVVADAMPANRIQRFVATDDSVEPDDGTEPVTDMHGSDMASIAAGVGPASSSEVVAIRLQESAWNMCVALDEIQKKRTARIVYTGAIALENTATPKNELQLVTLALDRLAEDGVAVFAAAGNKPQPDIRSPGRVASAITVGLWDGAAVMSSGGVAGKPTLLADWQKFRSFNGRCRDASTCFATAYLSGFVATWLERNPGLGRAGILTALEAGCTKIPGLSDDQQGFGVFDPAKALASVPLPQGLSSRRARHRRNESRPMY